MQAEERELALRTHIRNLLLDYSLTHLTTNYVTWTQNTVNELLSERLTYVPATDPTDILLPSDTYDDLLRVWRTKKITPYTETLTSDARALQVIKTHLQAFDRRERPTVRCWNEEVDVDYEQWLMLRPISPILSITSIRHTPRPGLPTGVRSTPKDMEEVLRSNNIKAVLCEDFPDEPPPKLQDVLQLKLPIDGQTQKDMTILFQSVAFLSSRNHSTSDLHEEAKAFLRADSPLLELPRLASPPLFPRDRCPGYHSSLSGAAHNHLVQGDLSDLPAIVPPVALTDEAHEELYKQHMVVVDGWQAYAVPSSPLTPGTPSLADSSSELDELMLPSSPGQCHLVEEIVEARLDEYELPRSHQIGGSQEKPRATGHGQSLSSFLSPLRRRHGSLPDHAKIVTTPKSQPSSPHTTITASMLGQPPTMLDGCREAGDTTYAAYSDPPSEGSDPGTDILLRRVYGAELATKDVAQIIMDEHLDDRDSLLMDVPVLPPPNEHAPNATFLPCAPIDLLAPARPKPGRAELPAVAPLSQPGHLKKAKGMPALTIELSWIPFNYGSSIPTDDEATGVAGSIGYALTTALQDEDPVLGTELADLLDGALNLETSECEADETARFPYDEIDLPNPVRIEGHMGDVDIILTRNERRALRGDVVDEDQVLGSSDKENERLASPSSYNPDEEYGPSPKRVRMAIMQEGAHDRFEQDELMADDSGIFLSSSEVPSGEHVGGFAELGYGAEGFEGLTVDGDLFGDIDPVHELGFDSGVYSGHVVRDVPWHGTSDGSTHWAARQVSATGTVLPYSTSTKNRLEDGRAESPFVHQTYAHNKSDRDKSRIPPLPEEPETSTTVHPQNAQLAISSVTSADLSVAVPSARRTLSEFLTLMGKKNVSLAPNSSPPAVNRSDQEALMQLVKEGPQTDSCFTVPAELLDSDVLVLPDSGLRPTTVHRYIASMALLQKRALVRSLASPECHVELIEREYLGDADLILDPDTAVVFVSLAALPSQADAVLARLTRLSWRYSYTLLVLEAYPESLSSRCNLASPRVLPYPFSPAVVKAAKKLRRDVNIAKACETMCNGSSISFAYALAVEEAASYARIFGDDAQARDTTRGALWGTREWLDFDEQEGEVDLAGVEGMNTFAASIVLSQMSLSDFLDTCPQDRVQYFGPYIGHARLVRFNEELARRTSAVQLISSSPVSIESRASA